MKQLISIVCIGVIVCLLMSGCQTDPAATIVDIPTVTTVTTSAVPSVTMHTTTKATVTSTTTSASTTVTTTTVYVPTTMATAAQVTVPPTTVYVPPTTVTTTPPTMPRPTIPSGPILDVDFVSQSGFPTGCESASATMLLRYWDVNMTLAKFVDRYLDKGEIRHTAKGTFAPHPAEKFVGDPRSTYAYGCYAPVIVRAINKCLPSELKVVNETGTSLSSLCSRYIDNGMPVMVWATRGMKPASKGDTWTVESTGKTFQWLMGEHCLLMIGYDKQNYYFMDPEAGGFVMYPRTTTEARYKQLGSQAVAICPIVTTTTTTTTTTATTTTTTTTTETIDSAETTLPPTESTTVPPDEETVTTTAPAEVTEPTAVATT